MKATLLYLVIAAVVGLPATTRANQARGGVICAGAATLDNGSIVLLGQPFVGQMAAPNGSVTGWIGFLPVLAVGSRPEGGPTSINPALSLGNGRFSFCFPTRPGRNYVVEASNDLEQWSPVSTNAGTWTGIVFEDTEAWRFDQRFYRVREL